MKKEDYTTGHLFDYRYIEENYVLIAKGLSKQKFEPYDNLKKYKMKDNLNKFILLRL